MRGIDRFVLFVVAMAWAGWAEAAPTACTAKQLLAPIPSPDDAEAHRRFTGLDIAYPAGTKKDDWGFDLVLRVGIDGQVVCYAPKARFRDKVSMDPARMTFLSASGSWTYTPFLRDGAPTEVFVTEHVREFELATAHLPLPDVPLAQVAFTLARGSCFGSCPSYRIKVEGDGTATYDGEGYVDVAGHHVYRIDPQGVADLVERARKSSLWSMRPSYAAGITDSATYKLTMAMGSQTHAIHDYVGGMAGMPPSVTAMEDAVDDVGKTDMWLHLSQRAVDALVAESFRFDSPEGAAILNRAVGNPASRDDAAMLRMIELGTPVTGAKVRPEGFDDKARPLLNAALVNGRVSLVGPLIDRGALDTDGRRDQAKIDEAFRDAIRGGNLAAVERIWGEKGDRPHPLLTFLDKDEDDVDEGNKPSRMVPVTLLLKREAFRKSPWQGEAIARWLVAKGCDPKASAANGATLLHLAADAQDAAMVRYALFLGIDPSTPGEYGLPALGSAETEDVAMVLLEAGTAMAMLNEGSNTFRRYATENHWGRVIAWLDAHPSQ
jgi:hypothetical protein